MVASIPLDAKHLDVKIIGEGSDDWWEKSVWNPGQYLKYADERGRPFVDLISRIAANAPARVVDLGCGPGNLTATLTERWPRACVEGLDSSPEMIERAAVAAIPGRLEFRVGDLREWSPDCPVDVLIANATLQWVPGHLDLLPSLVAAVAPGGWLGFQVPGNFGEPSHQILRELAAESRWGLATVGFPSSHEPVEYADVLASLGCTIDVWETTYLHVLTGADPVFEWISSTGARPVLSALDRDARAEFATVFKARLRQAYPRRDYGTVLPFRRIFAVARTGPARR
jgi:trans-aconitate 2-methyltransferase